MQFSSFFGRNQKPPIASASTPQQVPITSDSLPSPQPKSEPIGTYRNLSEAIGGEIIFPEQNWFLPTQSAWHQDDYHLRIWEKSRQVGATKTDAFDSVMKVA